VRDFRTVYVAGLFAVVIVCLVILAVPGLAPNPSDHTAIIVIGSAAMGALSGLLGALSFHRDYQDPPKDAGQEPRR
jgi:uncharacterized membrane protein YdcZ (DUF606 family)